MTNPIRWFSNKLQTVLSLQGLRNNPFVHRFQPGHFYSPIPRMQDALHALDALSLVDEEISDLSLNPDIQKMLLNEIAAFYPDFVSFVESGTGGRYHFLNEYFRYSDAIYLHGFLRKYCPSKLIEVGSGYSSALILDTREHYLGGKPVCTFIEPYPQRLESLLEPEDASSCHILRQGVQDVPIDIFDALDPGDICLIDSSHISKIGSDVNHLIFRILPRLKPGVLIHFHDIFYPFEYPKSWLMEGRAWNEAYLLRAFLMNNPDYEILLWADYAGKKFSDYLEANMPICLKDTGGSIWLKKN